MREAEQSKEYDMRRIVAAVSAVTCVVGSLLLRTARRTQGEVRSDELFQPQPNIEPGINSSTGHAI